MLYYAIWAPGVGYLSNIGTPQQGGGRWSSIVGAAHRFPSFRDAVDALVGGFAANMHGVEIRRIALIVPPVAQYEDLGAVTGE